MNESILISPIRSFKCGLLASTEANRRPKLCRRSKFENATTRDSIPGFFTLVLFVATFSFASSEIPQARAQEPASKNSTTQDSPPTADTDAYRLIQRSIEARKANTSQLRTAFGDGRVNFVVHESEHKAPVTVLDADIQIFFDAPKFRVHLLYEEKRNEARPVEGQSDQEFEKWVPSNTAERIIIYDGSKIFSVDFDRARKCEGTIYFGFAKMAVMRTAGFPFEDPVTLWSQALNMEGLDRRYTQITPLATGGFLGQLTKNTYRMKFFFLDDFGYDLRRVSSYRTGETQPFRDYLLNWSESNDVYYVRRFANTVTSASHDTGSAFQITRKLSVEYTTFDANIEIDPSVFTLSSIDIPDGSRFLDKRSSVNGGPKELIYQDSELTNAALQKLQPSN